MSFGSVGLFNIVHVLYIDESGTHEQARYFVVAGLALFETDTYFLAQEFDGLQARYLRHLTEPVELHVSKLRGGHGQSGDPYASLDIQQRRALVDAVYKVIGSSRGRLFAVAMEKSHVIGDPYERGFEELVNRFDRMLARLGRNAGQGQRGLIVAAESSYRENLEVLARKIAREGHRWGRTHNLADIPYFAPARNTRLLQAADFVANAVYARYESGLTRDFDAIAPRFDQDDGVIHGLVHVRPSKNDCYCPACISRRMAGQQDPPRLVDDEPRHQGGQTS